MKDKNKKYIIPRDVYRDFISYLESDELWGNQYLEKDTETVSFEYTSMDGHWFISGNVTARCEWLDESFSHEFGVYECGKWLMEEVESIDINTALYIDDNENEYEAEV